MTDFILGGGAPKSLWKVDCSHEIKRCLLLGRKAMTKPRQHIKKQRRHFANKGLYSQNYGFSSSHVQMWELDHKEGWVLKNWCFQIVVLEKILESLGRQGDQTSQSYGQSTMSIHWKDRCWSSNILAIWCEEPAHWKRPWCWQKLRARGKGGW